MTGPIFCPSHKNVDPFCHLCEWGRKATFHFHYNSSKLKSAQQASFSHYSPPKANQSSIAAPIVAKDITVETKSSEISTYYDLVKNVIAIAFVITGIVIPFFGHLFLGLGLIGVGIIIGNYL